MTPQDKLQWYLRDLLTLEVSTLVVDRVPDHVLLDLDAQLEHLATQWERSRSTQAGAPQAALESEGVSGPKPPLQSRFDRIASQGSTSPDRAESAGIPAQVSAAPDDTVAERAQLLARLLPDSDEKIHDQPEENLLAIRRIAALGSDSIALHTMISVNGDLVNLVAREYARPDQAAVRELHAEGVQHALGWWRTLSQFVVDCLGGMLGAIKQER